MSIDHTKKLAQFIAELHFDDLPEVVVQKAKMVVADYYAACLAGYQINDQFNQAVLNLIKDQGGIQQSTILFGKEKYPATQAAFMNAVYAHGADMDDGDRLSAGHIGASVISSVFAMGEVLNVTWRDVITAIVIGYEIFNRVGGAAQPDLYDKGFHSTGIVGGIACAAACAKLMDLDLDEIYCSISLAVIQSSGLILIDESGQSCKPINPANAARTGIISAQLAKQGIKSPLNPLDSQKGWFHAFSNEVDEAILMNELGTHFTICDSYMKAYPSCRHTHCLIDAALELRKQVKNIEDDWVKEIKNIEIYIYPRAMKSAGDIHMPSTKEEAKFSLRYAFAVALYMGKFGLNELVPKKDKEIFELIEKITVLPSQDMEDRSTAIRGADVKVFFDNGDILHTVVPVAKGEGVASFNWEDLFEKMLECASDTIGIENSRLLVEQCRTIDMSVEFEMWNLLPGPDN